MRVADSVVKVEPVDVEPGAIAEGAHAPAASGDQLEAADTLDSPEAEIEAAIIEASESSAGSAGSTRAARVGYSLMDRFEALISRLSSRNTFWHRVCSMIWLPYAFKSGIRMKRVDERSFTAELPFRRFNRNWYNAMAGASLLANAEIAGGMYIFNITGGDYTLVCKDLSYRFLRPCFGPAVYKITPREDLLALVAMGKEFNITLDLEVVQQALLPAAVAKKRTKDSVLARLAQKERRVGRCVATFHLTPSLHLKVKHGHIRAVGKGSELGR
jgi:hypothetical protein